MVLFWKEDSGRQLRLITPEKEGGDETSSPSPPRFTFSDDPDVPLYPPNTPLAPPGCLTYSPPALDWKRHEAECLCVVAQRLVFKNGVSRCLRENPRSLHLETKGKPPNSQLFLGKVIEGLPNEVAMDISDDELRGEDAIDMSVGSARGHPRTRTEEQSTRKTRTELTAFPHRMERLDHTSGRIQAAARSRQLWTWRRETTTPTMTAETASLISMRSSRC